MGQTKMNNPETLVT